jgi:streptogramin lyase
MRISWAFMRGVRLAAERLGVAIGVCSVSLLAVDATAVRQSADSARPSLAGRVPGPRLQTDGRATEFPLPRPGSGPTTIALARDGTVWFTEQTGNRIGRMSPDGTAIREFDLPNPGSAPRIITLGPDGNLWFTEHLGNRIGRITPDGRMTEFPIPTPASQPRAIALGPDGNLWFGEFAGGQIGRITPQGVITEFTIPTPRSGPRAIAAGPDGNLWFSEFNSGKIGRMTIRGEVTEFVLPRPDSGPGDITAGADGHMWFLLLNGRLDDRDVDGNRVGRITVDGTIAEFRIPSPSGSPINIAVGPDRNVWFTKQTTLGRVTPDGVVTEYPIPSAGTGLTAGSDRQPPDRLTDRLWYAASAGNAIGFLGFRP